MLLNWLGKVAFVCSEGLCGVFSWADLGSQKRGGGCGGGYFFMVTQLDIHLHETYLHG